jgi:hypothetical protein
VTRPTRATWCSLRQVRAVGEAVAVVVHAVAAERFHRTARALAAVGDAEHALRHFALDIIKADAKRKLGVANSRKRAGWDRNYLIELLTNA